MERLEEIMIKLGFSTESSMPLISKELEEVNDDSSQAMEPEEVNGKSSQAREPEEVNGKSAQAISYVHTVCFFICLFLF